MSKAEALIARTRELDEMSKPGNIMLIAEYRTIAPRLADMLERAMKELESLWAASGWCQDGQEAFEEIEAMAEGGA